MNHVAVISLMYKRPPSVVIKNVPVGKVVGWAICSHLSSVWFLGGKGKQIEIGLVLLLGDKINKFCHIHYVS